ncbi:uncharacterized protein MONBRDRAFT_36712 [Monosiga brevicollis MX1]|uniref:Uncharacterized protein n=1 Tax=Monosiga brevicollis TaxID=81824 RepID=A9UX13_MONBE|nr:uncharacterized protein MONBRDRAFT_36712 [Monosiga brevicollis MX1]EDQ90136.1 predicted protein [Monosiga brevicollis MX1]|eukprot:XP_001744903.1 hypothetical protein [Monosiga brevicollis MX1]
MLKNLKRRWCVLHEGTFMWFKARQDFIHAGWLTKIGGGTSTLGRKSWKRRWMALKGGELHYMPSQEEQATVLGVVDIQKAEAITVEADAPGKREFCFAIETSKRTYLMAADSEQEMQEWIEILNMVKGKSDEEINAMMAQALVNPRHAEGTVETEDILSVGPTNTQDVEGHPSFVIMTAERVLKFVAKDQTELDDWCRLLTPRRRENLSPDINDASVTERGWMLKAGGKGNAFKRRRWFVLRGDTISYYKNKDDDYTVGTIPLNSLCSVIPPDESLALQRNDWTFIVHSKHKSFFLTCKTQADCNRWINAIQDVIDNSAQIETPMEKLIDELKMASPLEVEQIYSSHRVLTYTSSALKSPLLPLPYGEIVVPNADRQYETLAAEAVKISASLLPSFEAGKSKYGTTENPVDLIKNVVQAVFDVNKLRNEVYCQVICQTTNAPNPGSTLNMTHWHLLAALCCSTLPSRKFIRFLKFHLKRTMDMREEVGEDVANVAQFCLDSIKQTKSRDFPPSTKEIEAIMSGQGLTVSVGCVGSRTIDLPVNSSTTCGSIIKRVKAELQLEESRNGFGLFETCGSISKFLEDKYYVSDVLSKWEKYEAHGLNPAEGGWKLEFKLFAFYDPMAPDLSKTEKEFLFEQAYEAVMNRRYPANEDTLIQLAALRTQFVVGDYEDGAYISDLVKVHPAQQPQLLASDSSSGGTLKRAGTIIKGTLKGLGMNTLRKLRGGTIKKTGEVSDAEMKKIKDKIVGKWKTMQGMNNDEAREAYMSIIQSWEGYGSNLFEVTQTGKKDWPKEIWLGISLEGVSIFPVNERERLAFHRYESVLSFGAPVPNKYKILVEGDGSMVFETNMVLEIAKLMKSYIKEVVSRRQ